MARFARRPRQRERGDSAASLAQAPSGEAPVTFAAMFDAHVDEVYRYVHRRCRDHQLAEDITQETFVRAIRSTDDPSTLSIGWLITVARNCLYDTLRRQQRGAEKLKLVWSADDPGHDAALVERLRVESALEDLSVEHRLVLSLHYIDGMTVPAIADELARTVKSVEGLITRARRAFRAVLSDEADLDLTQAEGSTPTAEPEGGHRG